MKCRILLIGMSNVLGGIEVYCFNLIKNKLDNFLIDVLFFEDQKLPFEDELIKMNVNILRICSRRKNFIKSREDFIKILQNNHYDIIHYHIMSYSWFDPILLASKYSKAKIIVHSHTSNLSGVKNKIMNFFGKRMVSKISFYKAACGNDAGKYMFKDGFNLFYNGIDIDKYKFDLEKRKKIRDSLNIDEDTIVYGLVARLTKQKNILFLIDIFNEIKKLNSNSKFILIGDGNLKNIISKYICILNLNDSFILLGRKDNVYDYLSSFDVFVMPSLFEGFSISLIEAQTNGLKCYVSSNVDCNLNICGNVSFISLKQSPFEWASKIINSNNLRDVEAYKKIYENFDISRSYNKVYEYYLELIKGE